MLSSVDILLDYQNKVALIETPHCHHKAMLFAVLKLYSSYAVTFKVFALFEHELLNVDWRNPNVSSVEVSFGPSYV